VHLTSRLLGAGFVAALVSTPALADPGWRASLAGGITRSNSECRGATSCDKNGSGLRAAAGWIGPRSVGFEVVAHELGATRATGNVGGLPVSVESRVRSLGAGVAIDHREGDWSFHGRLGATRARATLESRAPGLSDTSSDTSTQPYVSIGLGYRFAPGFTAIVAWDSLNAKNRNADYTHDVTLLSFGVQAQF